MNTTFLLTGGAGRIICAIPALEEFHQQNPNDDFKVLIHGWSNLYDSHLLLQNRTYDINQKGVFDLIVRNSILKVPEPYHENLYYNQRCHLVEAFQREILVDEYSPDVIPKLYLHSNEDATAQRMIQQALMKFKKKNFIVFQPFGSGMTDNFEDPTERSLTKAGFEHLTGLMAENLDAVILYMGDLKFDVFKNENVLLTAKDIPGADLRFFMAMIKNCDYFVGVDSVGQHMARSFNVSGTVVLGSTFETNVTYPDWFKVYRKSGFKPTYNPIRIAPFDAELTDRINSGIMNFTRAEIEDIFTIINDDLNGNASSNGSNFNGNI